MGMQIINIEQNTPEWHVWRQGGVGASDVPVIMGESPYKTALQLWREKVGLVPPPDLSNNSDIQRGHREEPAAREAFDTAFGAFTLPACGQDEAFPHRRVSFDGIQPSSVLEIKCPRSAKAAKVKEWAVSHANSPITADVLAGLGLFYWGQLQYQMAVKGVSTNVLWVWDADTQTGTALTIHADAEYQRTMLAKVDAFWACVLSETPPDASPDRDVLHVEAATPGWGEAEADYIAKARKVAQLKAQIKALEEGMDALKVAMVAGMGEYSQAVGQHGLKVTRFVKRGTVDYKAVLANIAPDIPDDVVEKYRRPVSEETRFTIPK